MNIKLLTEHHFEFLSLTEDCTGSSESTHVKMPHCWKSHVGAQIFDTRLSKYSVHKVLVHTLMRKVKSVIQ